MDPKAAREAEVSDDKVTIRSDKEVRRLEVSMDYPVSLECFDTKQLYVYIGQWIVESSRWYILTISAA